MSFETLSLLAPAFAAGAMIALVHVSFGIEVLKRGIIFLDLAVAQFAALGMITFHVFVDESNITESFMAAGSLLSGLGMALICALGIHLFEKKAGRYYEALIGSAFIIAASMSILVMSGDPHGGEEMKDILAGQVLWTTWQDLAYYGLIFIGVSAVWALLKSNRKTLFYILFAITIPFSVKLIGVYLVFASLILPALASVNILNFRYTCGYCISIISFALGLYASYIWDLPAGPAIVLAMLIVSILFWFIQSTWTTLNASKQEHQQKA